MTEINSIGAANSLPKTTTVSNSAESQPGNISFPQSDDDYTRGQAVTEDVKQNLKSLKNNIKLDEALFGLFGTDNIRVTGDGKMTYGQLRDKLGIPPRILGQVNNKELKDSDIIKGEVRVNLEDIGWYETTPQFDFEAQDNQYQRANGNYTAGYDRQISNEDIKNILK